MNANRNRQVLVRPVNPWCYPATLVPLVLLTAYGYLPWLVAPCAAFLLFFWFFSPGFAIYSKFRRPREPRQ